MAIEPGAFWKNIQNVPGSSLFFVYTIFMKFKLFIPEKLKNIKPLKVGGVSVFFWAKIGLLVLFMLLTAVMLINKFTLNKDIRIHAALESGQRMEVSLETGKITGRILKTVVDTEKEAGKKSSESSDGNNEFAWVHEDFIGPKLPQEIIEELVSRDILSPKFEVDRVSIKDISEKPVIIIIIKGLGLSASSTREALQLPKEVTMGVSPYSPLLDGWVKKIKEGGHEVILNIPMESPNYQRDDPGVYSLITQASVEDNLTRLKMLLSMTNDYSAIYSDSNEVFTRSINSITPVLEELKNKHKYFVYGGGYSNYSMIQVSEGINYPILVNDLVLDEEISSSAINDKFKEIEKIALEKGYVVVMAHPYPMTIRMLQIWISKAKDKGFVISPVSLLLGKVLK